MIVGLKPFEIEVNNDRLTVENVEKLKENIKKRLREKLLTAEKGEDVVEEEEEEA